jgi:hypothetical protein
MAMFTAYFDAAGNAQEQPVVVVSGYIANYLQWHSLELMWKNIHREHGVDLPFHMADFISATANPARYATQRNARADYVAIANDLPKAENFLKLLCIAAETIVNCGISCSVDMGIYNGVSSLLDLRTLIPPYALAARTCIALVHEWERVFSVEEPVECIFEAGDFEQGKFTELMVDEGLNPPIYRNKKDYAGLQAADQYSWEQYYFLKKESRGQHLPARNTFKFLLNTIPNMHRETSTAGLIQLCQIKGIDPRTGVKQ